MIDKYYSIKRFIRDELSPRQICRQLKWAWQRLFRGWDDRISWSIDSYLSEHVPLWIAQMRLHKGYPCMMVTDDIKDLPQDELDEICMKKWSDILDQIIDGFKAAQQISDGDEPVWDEYWEEYHKIHGDSLEWMSDKHDKTREELRVKLNLDERLRTEEAEFYERYNKGMDLFRQYYFNLWW